MKEKINTDLIELYKGLLVVAKERFKKEIAKKRAELAQRKLSGSGAGKSYLEERHKEVILETINEILEEIVKSRPNNRKWREIGALSHNYVDLRGEDFSNFLSESTWKMSGSIGLNNIKTKINLFITSQIRENNRNTRKAVFSFISLIASLGFLGWLLGNWQTIYDWIIKLFISKSS